MGQKVNPVGYRLGVNRGWDSVWYAKKKYLMEVQAYLRENGMN